MTHCYIRQRHWLHKYKVHHEYEFSVKMHTYVPPTSSSSPTWRRTTKQSFFFSETLNLKNFHLFAFIIKHCRATGCLFSSSPPPTYSMGSCTYPACAGYTNYHWQTQTEHKKKVLLRCQKLFAFCYEDKTQCYSPVRNLLVCLKCTVSKLQATKYMQQLLKLA